MVGYKNEKQKSGMLLYSNMRLSKKEIRKTISFKIAPKKKKILRNKLN